MINDRYYVKIVPQKGEKVHRFAVRRRHVAASLGVIALVLLGSIIFATLQTAQAHAKMRSLERQAATNQATLKAIDHQTDALRKQLQQVQRQNQEIRQLIGAPVVKPHRIVKTSWVRGSSLKAAAARIRVLSIVSGATRRDSDSMRTLAMRVLNIRRIRGLERAIAMASIPSIDPVDGASVIGCFCYRTYPDTEFHEGVDLGANYGDTVRASAAGTVAAAGWDGGYGIKVDIDHGNGYHTWYAHLSRTDVQIGEHVYKGETIASVGSTGFSTGPHLHYQVMYQGNPVDPTPFLSGIPANVLASLP